jgi:ribonuclease HI
MLNQQKTIRIWIDGGSSGNPGRGAIAFLIDVNGEKRYLSASVLDWEATNNEAEYEALRRALIFTSPVSNEDFFMIPRKYTSLLIFTDSQLIVNHLKGKWKIDKKFDSFIETIKFHLNEFKSWEIKWIPKEKNKICDSLVKLVLYKKL